MRTAILISMALAMALTLNAQTNLEQDTIFNQTDNHGLKQGFWKKRYPNSNIQYEGYFVNDKPEGLLKRYFEDGSLKAEMHFYNKGTRARASIYYQNGSLAGTGNFVGPDKDSTWNYYSFYEGSLSTVENYHNGELDGLQTKYYPGGEVLEVITWGNGIKHGHWKRYYDNGQVLLKSSYHLGSLKGLYLMFNPGASPLLSGKYDMDKKSGIWRYFNESGKLMFEIEYVDGIALNQDELDLKELEYMEMIEGKKGKIPEPTLEDLRKK